MKLVILHTSLTQCSSRVKVQLNAKLTVIFCMATQIDESRLRKKTLLNLICCTLNLRKVYYTLNIQCSTHAQNCRSVAKYSSTIQCVVHSFAEWPGVTINQGGKSRPAEKRSLAIWQEDILLLLLPFDIKYQAISS